MSMLARTLLYHDVIKGPDSDASGFSGINPAEYKLDVADFERHLAAISENLTSQVVLPESLLAGEYDEPPVLLSFDDGGVSAYELIAPMLEAKGWRGVFFITTDRIGTPAFVTEGQLRDLHERGHVIGSHSCSHPKKMSECTMEQLLDEWQRSLAVLSGILGMPVTTASVPGGFYARHIAEAAAQSGIRVLFTSEPVQRITNVSGCYVIGRFSIKRGMGVQVPVEFVLGSRGRIFRQYAYWNLKKAAKTFSGPVYPWVRSIYLSRKQA